MIDYEIESTDTGFDIVLPLAKVTDKTTLLFNQVRLLLDTYLGEFPYDNRQGIDYESFLGDSVNLTNIRSKYYNKISKLQYFGALEDFAVNLTANRKLEISFKVVASNGDSEEFIQGF